METGFQPRGLACSGTQMLPSKSALELPKGTMPAADSARLRAALVIPTPQFGVPFPLGWGRCFLHPYLPFSGASQMALVVKNPSASAGDIRDSGLIPRWRISPGGGHGNPLSILAWRIPRTEEPGRLQSMGLQRVRHN